MNILPQPNGDEKKNELFDLEERYEQEFKPLAVALCNKAAEIGLPIFVITCYKSDEESAWLSSCSRARDGFVPKEFFFIRAILEGEMKIISFQ